MSSSSNPSSASNSPPRADRRTTNTSEDVPPSPSSVRSSGQNQNQNQQTTNTNTNTNTLNVTNVRRFGSSSGFAGRLPAAASTRSLAEMSTRSMDSPNNASLPHEVIEFLRAQSVAQEDVDTYKKIFDEQLLRNFSDIKNFGEDRLATSGVKRGHARRIFSEIERRDRETAQQQRQLQQQRRRGGLGGLRQSVSTANLYGALYDMTPVATPVAGESHGLFPSIAAAANNNNISAGSNQNLESLVNATTTSAYHQDPNNNNLNNNISSAMSSPTDAVNVIVDNSAHARADPFRTSALVVPGDFCCGMCCDLLYSARTVPCGHTFCALCLERWAASQQGSPTCPLCRADLIPKGQKDFELPAVNSLLEGLCQRCFPGRYQRSAKSADEQRRSDEEIRLAYALVRHPADALLVKILLNNINISRPLELLFLRLPRREFLPPSFLPSANRIETGSISPTPVEGYGFNMTSASLHATIMNALQLEPGHWFLDAGAGTGIVAAWAATLVGPTGTSLALDHDTKAAQLMRRNRIIHDQMLYHPTMPLSGANFAGEVTTLSDKYCLFPNLASAPIAGRRTMFQNLLLNPSVYTANSSSSNNRNNNNNNTEDENNNNNNKPKPLPIAVQILGVERSSAFLDRFAGSSAAGNKNHQNSNTANNNSTTNPPSPQTQQSQPFGGGGCVVHATVTIGNSGTSSRRQCRMVGTVRLIKKTDQFQVLSSSQHQQAKNAVNTRITPSTHPRSYSPERNNTNNNNQYSSRSVTAIDDEDENENEMMMTRADRIPPVLPSFEGGQNRSNNNDDNNNNNNTNLSDSLSDESVLCDITDTNHAASDEVINDFDDDEDLLACEDGANGCHQNNNINSNNNSKSSFLESKLDNDHHVLFSLREVSLFGSDDSQSVFNFGDPQAVDHERLMRFTFCLTKPIGELLSDNEKNNHKTKSNGNNNNNDDSAPSAPIDAFGIFVASYLRRSDVVATSTLQLLDGSNVMRQLKKWIDGSWIPSELKPHKYHCLQTNIYDVCQVLFGKNRDRKECIDSKQKIIDLIKPTVSASSASSRSETPARSTTHNNLIPDGTNNENDDAMNNNENSSTSMMNSRANTAAYHGGDEENNNNTNTHHQDSAENSNSNNNKNDDPISRYNFVASNGFFDRVFLACEPQSEADLTRFQRLLRPGGRMVVPFDSELLLLTRPASTNNTNNDPSYDPFEEAYPRENLYSVGFGTFVTPDYHRATTTTTNNNNNNSTSNTTADATATTSTTAAAEPNNNNTNEDHAPNDHQQEANSTTTTNIDGDNDEKNEDPSSSSEGMGTTRSGPVSNVTKQINDAIVDERNYMKQLEDTYRIHQLSAMRNRSLKNSPYISASASPYSRIQKMNLNDDDDDDNNNGNNNNHQQLPPLVENNNSTNGNKNNKRANSISSSTGSSTSSQNDNIHLRCCGNKLSNAKWSDAIDVSKIWGAAPFADGQTVCINRPDPLHNFNAGTSYLKRARGTSYLAYNIDLCARMSYVACAHCNVIVGAEFCDEPLLTQPDGPWTGRLLLCSSMICRKKDVVAEDADISADSIKCNSCETSLALPGWRLRSEMELRLRHSSRARSILASADFSGQLFSHIRRSAIRIDDQNNGNGNNNNKSSNRSSSNLKMFTDANLDLVDVKCSTCDQVIGFKVLSCRNPFAKTRFAFALGRIALMHTRVKGMPSAGLRQPQNLMERIYRAIAQSFGVNPGEGAQFILRDGSGNATVFDGPNLMTWRVGEENENEDEDGENNNNNTDDDGTDEPGNIRLGDTNPLPALTTEEDDVEQGPHALFGTSAIDPSIGQSNNNSDDQDSINNRLQAVNSALAARLVNDFDLVHVTDENDPSDTEENEEENDDDDSDEIIRDGEDEA